MDGLIYSSFYALIPIAALVIDTIYGDPRSDWHPVVLIGKLISFYENKLYPEPKTSNGNMFLRGMVTVLLVLLTVGIITGLLVWLSVKGGILFYAAMGAVILYFTITPRALCRDGMEIYHLLKAGDIVAARNRLSWIVGRDTERLSEAGVTKAAVETVAENTSDGVIAPLFYLALGGPVLGWVYKAVNTMDSMVGYKNEAYLYFGRAAAKLDDLANFLPARLSAGLMVLAAAVLGMDWWEGMRIFFRDRFNHASPNSAQTEAVCAGVLHVQLAGDAWYFGTIYKKKTIGDDKRPVEAEDIPRACRLMYGAAWAAALAAVLVLAGIRS